MSRDVFYILGPRLATGVYLTAGIVGSVVHNYGWKMQPIKRPPLRNEAMLGASGSVSAMLMYSILQWPNRIFYLYGIVPVPAVSLYISKYFDKFQKNTSFIIFNKL